MEDKESSILPERVVYGSFGRRLGASIIDSLVLLTPTSIITGAFGNHSYYIDIISGRQSSQGLYASLLNGLVMILYFAAMESSKSQATVGKMALKLKVTGINGERISFTNAVGRYLSKFISTIIIFIGFLMVLWDEKHQALHDKLAGTLVVKTG